MKGCVIAILFLIINSNLVNVYDVSGTKLNAKCIVTNQALVVTATNVAQCTIDLSAFDPDPDYMLCNVTFQHHGNLLDLQSPCMAYNLTNDGILHVYAINASNNWTIGHMSLASIIVYLVNS